MRLPRSAKSRAFGQKRQERRVDVEVLASRLDFLEEAFGCVRFQVDGGRLALGYIGFDHVADPAVGILLLPTRVPNMSIPSTCYLYVSIKSHCVDIIGRCKSVSPQ